MRSFTRQTHARLLKDGYSPGILDDRELVRDKRHPCHRTVVYVSLSVLTQLGQQTAGSKRGVSRVKRGELSYIPSIGAVCLPNRSLPVQSREIGREEFPLSVQCWTRPQPHSGLCAPLACVCVCDETKHPVQNDLHYFFLYIHTVHYTRGKMCWHVFVCMCTRQKNWDGDRFLF